MGNQKNSGRLLGCLVPIIGVVILVIAATALLLQELGMGNPLLWLTLVAIVVIAAIIGDR